jgi:hypothetical protein
MRIAIRCGVRESLLQQFDETVLDSGVKLLGPSKLSDLVCVSVDHGA